MHDRRRRLDVDHREHHGGGVDFLRRVQSFSIYFQECFDPGRKALVSFGLPAAELCQLSPFLPPCTVGVMTVNCQVGAQEEELSWFDRQVATALPAEAASEQQRASCPERERSERLRRHLKPQTECAMR